MKFYISALVGVIIEIITVCSDIHTKQINVLFGQNVGVFIVELGDM